MNETGYHDRYECHAKGWFSETGKLWEGQAMSIQVKEKLHD
jgi:hypothetical protein